MSTAPAKFAPCRLAPLQVSPYHDGFLKIGSFELRSSQHSFIQIESMEIRAP